MMALLKHLWPLNRNILGAPSEQALEIVGQCLPQHLDWRILRYPSGQKCWTWTIPENYELDEAYLELLTPEGLRRVLDAKDHPLHILSYSPSVTCEMGFSELAQHLHHNPNCPKAIPWAFKFYERDWGFCLSEEAFQALPRDGRYRVVIKSRFTPGHLPVGELTIPGETDEYLLLIHDICHPCQVNDSISGTVVAVDVARILASRPQGRYGLKIVFLPETIGALAYLSANEDLIGKIRFALNADMVGNDSPLRMQRSRQDNSLIDQVARQVARDALGETFQDDPYCHMFGNDEKVTNAPGVDIPTVAFNRWPFLQYHTSEDSPDIIVPENLEQVVRIYVDIIDILQADYYPRRQYKGLLFVSGLDLDFDWTETVNQKRRLMQVLGLLEGNLSIFQIASRVGLDFYLVKRFIDAMKDKGAIKALYAPYSATDGQ
ncbi:MAG: DUF4910 domain-containing protein [Alphaproteobacteria bacterium]|nr:DUF4910 domain-containing protein [Alphaproteobacteria bacterium]